MSFRIITATFILVISGLACGGSDTATLEQEAIITALEATNSAQQNQLLEQENKFLRMTVEAQKIAGASSQPIQPQSEGQTTQESEVELGSVSPSVPTSPPPPENVLFFEDFSNNNNGWDLRSDSNGAVRLSQKQLLVTVNKNKTIWLSIPEFEIGDEFYAEAQLTVVADGGSPWLGWGIGDSSGNIHKFLANRVDGYAYYDNITKLIQTNNKGLFSTGTPFVVGLEILNGYATLFVNGDEKDIFPIQPYGKNIGVVLWVPWPYYGSVSSTIAVDNITVRESR